MLNIYRNADWLHSQQNFTMVSLAAHMHVVSLGGPEAHTAPLRAVFSHAHYISAQGLRRHDSGIWGHIEAWEQLGPDLPCQTLEFQLLARPRNHTHSQISCTWPLVIYITLFRINHRPTLNYAGNVYLMSDHHKEYFLSRADRKL